jgi:hypothetical protein
MIKLLDKGLMVIADNRIELAETLLNRQDKVNKVEICTIDKSKWMISCLIYFIDF